MPKQQKKKQNTTAKKKAPTESKQQALVTLLKRTNGATIEEMVKATGWQQHSIRGMMSGVLKKRLGLTITSDTETRGRVYRIAA